MQAKAIDQWTRELPIIARRGLIYDRNGIVLAGNADTFTVFFRPRSITDDFNTAKIVSEVLELDYEKTLNKCQQKSTSSVTIKRQVDKGTLDILLSHNLNGVYYSRDNTRVYPYGDLLSQVLGFTTEDNVGQSGLEAYYNEFLRGIEGEILYEADLVGIDINKNAKYLPATDGLNITLTIDYYIQAICESAIEMACQEFSPKSASAIVLDVNSGEILAMVNKPSFNLNEVPRDDLNYLNSVNRNSLLVDVYEPGSTFKILTASANVQENLNGNVNAFSLNHVFNSSRTRTIDGQTIKCWNDHKNGKHLNLTLAGGLNNSCNPIFVDIALSLGKDTMYKYLDLFNYGKVTGVDFYGEASGLILPKGAIKNCDLARIGFGQTIAVTPLQLANATASAINGGLYYKPHLLKEIISASGIICEKISPSVKNKTISQTASKIIAEMLEEVVTSGSGKNAYIEGYRVGGKTGTAQKYENGKIAVGKYVSSFVGFFPANNPQYLTLVILDEPQKQHYGSTVAAPYAKKIFEGIIEYKNILPFN